MSRRQEEETRQGPEVTSRRLFYQMLKIETFSLDFGVLVKKNMFKVDLSGSVIDTII